MFRRNQLLRQVQYMFAIGDSLVPCDEVGRLSIQSNILIALASFPFLQTAADLLAASLFLERLSARPLLRNIILHTGEGRACARHHGVLTGRLFWCVVD